VKFVDRVTRWSRSHDELTTIISMSKLLGQVERITASWPPHVVRTLEAVGCGPCAKDSGV